MRKAGDVRHFERPDLEHGADPANATSTLMIFAAEMRGRFIHNGTMLLAGRCCAAYGDDMASDPPLELRVSRLENDNNSTYDLIAGISSTQQEHTRRFDSVDRRLESVNQRLGSVDQRLDAVDRRLESVDRRLDAVDQRFDSVDQRFDAVDRRFDSVEATLAEVVRRLPEPS